MKETAAQIACGFFGVAMTAILSDQSREIIVWTSSWGFSFMTVAVGAALWERYRARRIVDGSGD